MFSAIRRRLHLSPATAIAVLALVFAMSGGAYAASRYVITSTKQISPKVLKDLQGRAGAKGATGATGPAGAAGAKGETGAAGSAGAKGETGPAGEPGKKGTNGLSGKAGAEGKEGKEGSPWTDGGTLPSGSSEKGAWSTSIHVPAGGGAEEAAGAISFQIPLATDPKAFYFTEKEVEEGEHAEENGEPAFGSSGCKGTAESPEAPKGTLCIFTGGGSLEQYEWENVAFGGLEDPHGSGTSNGGLAGPTGELVLFHSTKSPSNMFAEGSWAVTAE